MMEIGMRYSGGVTVIVPQGSITMSGVDGLRAALSGEPKGHGIVIDAQGLEYLCPAAAELLRKAEKRCGKENFQVVNASDAVRQMMRASAEEKGLIQGGRVL